ncbi:MAG: branched-chain amino acid transport system II carrier protein, partial [Aeromonas sp.]
SRVVIPTMLISLLFGVIDGIKGSALVGMLPEWSLHLPLAEQGLAWLLPSLLGLMLAAIYDRLLGRESVTAYQ